MSGTAEGAQGSTGEQLLLRVLQAQQEQMQAQQAQMEQLQRLVEQGQRPRGSVVDTKATDARKNSAERLRKRHGRGDSGITDSNCGLLANFLKLEPS